MTTFAQWLYQVHGHTITAPGGIGGECVDLTNDYLGQVWGVQPVRLNAASWRSAPLPPEWTWELNAPTNVPPLGSIVVWRGNVRPAGIGPYGHVAIALVCDEDIMWTLDQNWAGERIAAVQWHSYFGVYGWWKRTRPATAAPATKTVATGGLSPQPPPVIPR